ncbi:MAG: sulfatase-like hydrolase/transferase [Psychroserpens sp.]|nr:sulfatase-like hydrolase/transferase [Psychroserpens sp.]
MTQRIQDFINDSKEYPILAGFASGLPALLYLYDRNFNLVNSGIQFVSLTLIFLVIPAICFWFFFMGIDRLKSFKPYKSKLIAILNLSCFTFFILYATYGLNKKKLLLLTLVVAGILGYLLFKQVKKSIVIQLLLSLFILFRLMPTLYQYFSYSYQWQTQKDDIIDIAFKKHPNIYVLQPDGYVGFDVIEQSPYRFNNSKMKSFLSDNGFQVYDDFRSNYTSTLTSNSSMFSMAHHYYNNNADLNSFYKGREIILKENPVLQILKKNGYQTHLILDVPYMLVNRVTTAYDVCNINPSEIQFLSRGFEFRKDTYSDLMDAMDMNKGERSFFFVREPNPSHVQTRKEKSLGKDKEREMYLERLQESNDWIEKVVSEITFKDPQALIVLSSDHGGFVGFDHTAQSMGNVGQEELVHSMFSSILAVKWPDKQTELYEEELKSPVNLFRVIFSYLSMDSSYLNGLQEDTSYGRIQYDLPKGVYKLIDDNNEILSERISE